MASRALIARFSSTSSNCVASASAGQRAGGKVGDDTDRAAERAGQQVRHAGHERIQIDRLGLQVLPARKGQQLAGQLGAVVGRASCILEQGVRAAARHMRAQQVDTAANGHEQIVELVRDTAGELADRFEPLAAAARLFCFEAR